MSGDFPMSRNIAAILRTVELAKAQRVKRRHTTAEVPADEDAESYARFQEFHREYETNEAPDCRGVTPGLVKVSTRPEPKSIHSPVPPLKIQFERPAPRKACTERNDRYCELPAEKRRRQVVTIVNGQGKPHARVLLNPFTKRMKITQKGLP
jgi:hypothetical protein